MKIMVFDTETVGLEKCFCYDIGYVIVDTADGKILVEKEFIIEQIWSNRQLFETAYYAEKRDLYVSKMRGRKAKLTKWGFAIAQMIRDIELYEVDGIYAYNSTFDTKVFDFNADWYKSRNALDYAPVFDIWGYTSQLIADGNANEYVEFAETNNLISESGNLQNNADGWGKFFYGMEWNEEHTALEDSKIESKILLYCLENGLKLNENYKPIKCIKANTETVKTLQVKDADGNEYEFEFKGKTEYKKNGWRIVLR